MVLHSNCKQKQNKAFGFNKIVRVVRTYCIKSKYLIRFRRTGMYRIECGPFGRMFGGIHDSTVGPEH